LYFKSYTYRYIRHAYPSQPKGGVCTFVYDSSHTTDECPVRRGCTRSAETYHGIQKHYCIWI